MRKIERIRQVAKKYFREVFDELYGYNPWNNTPRINQATFTCKPSVQVKK